MNIYTITALLLCSVLTPVIVAALVVTRQEVLQEQRDHRWLSRSR